MSISHIALIFYSLKQRRRGKQEAALAAQRQEQDRVELERFKKEGRDPDALAFDGAEYNSKSGVVATVAYTIPDSPPGSSAGPPETTWDPTSSASAATAAMPLLRDDAMASHRDRSSPGIASPTHSIASSLCVYVCAYL